jgi:hypothetical protein
VAPVLNASPKTEAAGELEIALGQDWFAAAGILTLALGGGFMLSLPYSGWPSALPSVLGYLAVAVFFGIAQAGRRSFTHAAGFLHGAGMALLYWATLRLYFFGEHQVLDPQGPAGAAVLVAAAGFNLGFSWWRRSAWLMALAFVTACATPLVINGDFAPVAVVGLAAAVAAGSRRAAKPVLFLGGIGLVFVTYLLWAMGNPLIGGNYHWVPKPWFAPGCLLAALLIFGTAPLRRVLEGPDDAYMHIGTALTCGLGYALFLLHTAAAFQTDFAAANALASVLLLGIAVAFWVRRRSRVSTFFYAMTGYAALTMAIVKQTVVPDVFVWLTLQSLLVVATAIWFRSRFIIVANFLIYTAILGGYVAMNEDESGISLGIGVVALVSARILNWQQDRLELKTGIMRNAYLLSAFLVFPYALHHLAPLRGVALSWIGLAVVYYVLSLVFQNQKYRWMGHATLFLTAAYLVVGGAGQLEPVYRVVSFLALGTVLMIVSLVFKRLRTRAG